MHSVPRRTRTAESGACSNCVKTRQRCYVGVSGGSCSSCRRAKLDCDAHGSTPPRSVTEEPSSLLTYCPEDIFASQLRESERECNLKNGMAGNPAVPSTIPLDYHISIINQLFGPGSADPPAAHLPSYLAGLPDRLHRDDVEYLRRSGALDLPSDTLRNELLKSYLLWVHPHMPILGLHEFLSAVADSSGFPRIGLLLFHAVLFAASAFVDVCHIRAEGYPSRSVFRESLSRKVKVLLDLECEDDRLATAQAILLMVSHPEPHRDQKELTQRLGICISMISSCQTQMVNANARKQQIWRRTWWSIYNHVRITSSNLLTSMNIPENGSLCDTPLPSTRDFRFGALCANAQTLVESCDFLRDVQYQQFLARLFIEKARLCQIGQFPGPSADLSDSSGREGGLANAENKASPTEIAEFAQRLGKWHAQLPPALRHQSPVSSTVTELERFILIHRAWLLLLYLASAYVVCTRSVGSNSHAKEHILNKTSLIFDELHRLGFINLLPNSSIAILVPGVEFHIKAVESAHPQTNEASQRMLQKYSEILHQLQDTSSLAGRMIEKLSNVTAPGTQNDLSRLIFSESAIAEPSVSHPDFAVNETDDFYNFLESGMSFANVIPSVDDSPNIGLNDPLSNESYLSQFL
ncbi:hypothetical protein IFM58399_10097 [Aspergillus lentulus]|uniref:transcription factor domain-containing protein n=1 Tax=Aspergillus lentulus TaxID=293939 RepID=UPI001392A348|nr:uncharacterized protein IFM58399_10097 [Aspergillus lentulus]GFF55535.1 hypothetical protein IFM58399_10097 [Aspergillus lentulus]GFF66978.1 hypothetical protein IFM62136_06802 [Aspergillus lentulus]GFF92255.1 hypothetical protein IFM47457_09123 [Aspergillus lentulus]GFG11271.1 hypothetical protein IFM61392_06828 [Aspergillus lentulus]